MKSGFPKFTTKPTTLGRTNYRASGEMCPESGEHTRGTEFRFPRLRDCMSVSVKIVPEKHSSPMFLYELIVNQNISGKTQFVVHAQTSDGKPVKGKHRCSIAVIATPL